MTDDLRRTSYFDEQEGVMTNSVTQDVEPYLEENKIARLNTPEFGRYKGNLVHAASIPVAVIEMMRNGQCCTDGIKYNLLSDDPEEKRRALVRTSRLHKRWFDRRFGWIGCNRWKPKINAKRKR